VNAPERNIPDNKATGLVSYIKEQATREAQQILADASQRAQQIRDAAGADAEALRAAARHEGEVRGRRRAAQLLALAEAQARRSWLRAREQLLEGTIEQACVRLADLPAFPGADAIIAQLAGEAFHALPPHPLRVRIPPRYAASLRAVVRQHHQPVVVECEEASVAGGGVIVETQDGRLCFDNSFEARVRRNNEELRSLIATALLEDRSTPAAASATGASDTTPARPSPTEP